MRPGPLIVVGVGLLWFILSGRAAAVVDVFAQADTASRQPPTAPTTTGYTPQPGPVQAPVTQN